MTLSNALQNSTYVKFDLISTFLLRLGVEDFSGGLKSLIRLKLFPQESLMTGDAFELIPDLIDVRVFKIKKFLFNFFVENILFLTDGRNGHYERTNFTNSSNEL